MKQTIKLKLLQLGSLITSLAPLGVAVGINWNSYVTAGSSSPLKLTIGGVLAAAMIALTAVGKLKIKGKYWGLGIALVLVYLLEPILADMKMLLLCVLGGDVLNTITFSNWVNKYKEKIEINKQADATAKATEDIIKEVVSELKGKV